MGILLISLASATTIIAGNCLPVNLSELDSLDNVIYDVLGNSSNLEGLTIELNGTIANICTVPNYKPDSFTIIFIDDSTKEVIKEVPISGGGGSSSCRPKKDFDWNCSKWTECINETQTRLCKEYNNCHNAYGRPNVTKDCKFNVLIDEPIVSNDTITGGCGTVTPGMEDKCCQNLGFDRWNKDNLKCENKPNHYFLNSVMLILVILTIIFLTKKKVKRKLEKSK